jgi:hypothetical protein
MGSDAAPGNCEQRWWKYVYSPERLKVLEPCATVRGTVLRVRHPLDGDAIVYVRLDPEYARFSNQKLKGYGKDALELEIVCKHPVFKFLVFKCWSCKNRIPVPGLGDHVEADGFYVEDGGHGHTELHPVTRLTVLPPAAPGKPSSRTP